MKGINLNWAVGISLFGIVCIVLGSIKEIYIGTRLAGFMIASFGIVILATRLYERLKQRRLEMGRV